YSSYIYFVFFFQAEDGIRDFHVTGVQTCALPISSRSGSAARRRPARRCSTCSRSTNRKSLRTTRSSLPSRPSPRTSSRRSRWGRSEERRVGTERGARWAAEGAKERERGAVGLAWR